jgi:hypothetical protein
MSEVREEYTRENYPTSGKKYNGEKAIISLTSWRARINTVSKTLYSLIKQCPGFHIVLVLSEEEFPQKEKELPENLMVFVENELIELLWVWKNYKSFKKVLFTMDKYRDVPVISADDGCIYVKNFAQPLYDLWLLHKTDVICNVYWYNTFAPGCGGGSGVLYPPNCFGNLGVHCVKLYHKILLKNLNDDRFIANLSKFCKINIRKTKNIDNVFKDIDGKFGMGLNKKYIKGSNWRFFKLIKKSI